MKTEKQTATVAEEEEILRFYTQVLRGAEADGKTPALSERLKAAEQLLKRKAAREQEAEALGRLDALLEAIRHAAD